MKNRICIIAVFLLVAFYGNSQNWTQELEKHIDKSVSDIGLEMEKYFEVIGKTRTNKYHKYLRWYDYASNHQNEEGFQFNHSLKNEELLERMQGQIKKYASKGQNDKRHYHGGWSAINPNNFAASGSLTPFNGRINCIAKPTQTSSIIYAGTATGGVWKSFNDGASWTPQWDGMVQTGVSSIVIDYNNPNHILALTGDADSQFIPSQGVYQSYDGGDTWTLAFEESTINRMYGFKLLQSKTDEYVYYICSKNTYGPSIIEFNISTGLSIELQPSATIFDLEYQTNNDDIIWASGTNGLYKKIGDDSFSKVNHPNLPTSYFARSAIAMAPSNENIIYYAVAYTDIISTSDPNPDFYGMYKSTDKGENWEIVYDTLKPNIMTTQCWYNFSLEVDPKNENKVYFGSNQFYESSIVGGEMMFTLISDYIHPDIHNTYHFGGNHYVCTDGGISVKTPNSTTYNSINNGLICTQFYDIDTHNKKLIGGTQDNGTFIWDIDDLTGFRRLGGDGLDCMIDPLDPNIMFLSNQGKKYRSTDGGLTNNSLFNSEWHDPIAYDVGDSKKVIIHAIDELKISYDNGVTFPASIDVFGTKYNVNSISQCEDNSNVLYLAKGDSLARTDNFNADPSSVTWTKRELSDKDYIRDVLVHPDSCGVVFVVASGYFSTQILKSTNGGQDFEGYSEGISELPVYCIRYDHVNGNGYYIGTELGIFYRNSTMEEWIPFSNYLPRVPVYDLKVEDNYVYAATYGRGIWRSPGYKTCPANLILYQVNDPTAGANSGQQIHKASNIIVSDRIIRGKIGTDVLYQAGNYIELTEGFHAKRDNLFTARAAGCLD